MTTADTLQFPRVLDATMLSDWHKCPHSFFRKHVQGLTRPRSNVHLHFGGCLAAGLEAARRAYADNVSVERAVHAGLETVLRVWGDFEGPPAPTRTEAAKSLSACLAALQSYFREWPLDDTDLTTHIHNGEPCIEWSGAAPIPGPIAHPETGEPLLYAGRFDLIADYNRSTWGLDDKTTGVDPASDYWRNQWKLRGQFTGYSWLAREYGIPLSGFIVRGIGVLKTDIKHSFALVPRPPWMIDAWLRQLHDDVQSMVYQYAALTTGHSTASGHAFAQRFDTACADFGGCSFLDLCTSEHPDDWLTEYEVRRWDPLARGDDTP